MPLIERSAVTQRSEMAALTFLEAHVLSHKLKFNLQKELLMAYSQQNGELAASGNRTLAIVRNQKKRSHFHLSLLIQGRLTDIIFTED